jgi:hypothetical protein
MLLFFAEVRQVSIRSLEFSKNAINVLQQKFVNPVHNFYSSSLLFQVEHFKEIAGFELDLVFSSNSHVLRMAVLQIYGIHAFNLG